MRWVELRVKKKYPRLHWNTESYEKIYVYESVELSLFDLDKFSLLELIEYFSINQKN